MNLIELIRVAIGVGVTTSKKLGVGAGGELMGAPTTRKDFQIAKA
jgi:hypothetical protein